jgi:mannose-6-phosphate isomerase-like protein (cupin superfamily)
MIIDFSNIPEKKFDNFKGGDKHFINRAFDDDDNKIMFGVLEPGSSIGYHKHETNSETIFVISGEGHVLYDNGEEDVKAGQVHYCPMGHSHSLINKSESIKLEFFAVVGRHQ